MAPSSTHISQSIIENLKLTWQMYKEAIDNIPEEEWKTGPIDYLIPARLILHGIEALDYYSPKSPEITIHEIQYNLDDQNIPAEQLPDQTQMNQYLLDVIDKLETWIKNLDDEQFHIAETEFPWTGSTVHGRILYSIEHARHHLGELNGELRRRGLPRVKWSFKK